MSVKGCLFYLDNTSKLYRIDILTIYNQKESTIKRISDINTLDI